MMFNNIWLVYRKELVDIIRDRRTIISMIIIPILIFPLLTVGLSTLISVLMMKSRAELQRVVIVNGQAAPELRDLIISSGKVEVVTSDSIEAAILKKRIQAAMVIPDNFKQRLEAYDTLSIQILSDDAETKSRFASQKLRNILADYRQNVLESRLKSKGLDKNIVNPFEIQNRNVASKEKMGSQLLSLILPYMILLLSLTGAMYTAMDLTAGEKERGTLETLLTSPIPRWQLAAGKFLTVLTTSIVSTMLAIISMTATMAYAISAGGSMAEDMALRIAPASVIVILLMVIPTASLFSAVLMSISLSARTYKEAQSYVTPFMMVVIMPAMASFIPGIELGWKLAFVPFVNVSLCIKEALMGNINWLFVALVFLSTALYAAFAIFVARRLFEKESVLFGN
jgi:sodium transport system permease protein